MNDFKFSIGDQVEHVHPGLLGTVIDRYLDCYKDKSKRVVYKLNVTFNSDLENNKYGFKKCPYVWDFPERELKSANLPPDSSILVNESHKSPAAILWSAKIIALVMKGKFLKKHK